MPQITKKL